MDPLHEDIPVDRSEVELLAQFDSLVETGKIFYDYSFRTEYRKDKGLEFEFRISNALQNKPGTPWSDPAGIIVPGPGPRPGGDINTHGIEVGPLSRTHVLAFNGFSTYRPHYLLMPNDGYRRQWEALDVDDFEAISSFLDTNDRDYLVFYNCGAEAGCSRVQKHLQAIPKASFHGNPWLNMDQNSNDIPFAFYKSSTGTIDPRACLNMYLAGLEAVKRTLKQEVTLENGVPPHNMIMDRGRIIVIPRRAAGIYPLGANSGGMLGMIWTQSEEAMQRWMDASPHSILRSAGVPELL